MVSTGRDLGHVLNGHLSGRVNERITAAHTQLGLVVPAPDIHLAVLRQSHAVPITGRDFHDLHAGRHGHLDKHVSTGASHSSVGTQVCATNIGNHYHL